jgi:hypothetical protein
MEEDDYGQGDLFYAARDAQYKAMRWLLTEAGASISEVGSNTYYTVWSELNMHGSDYELSALLKVMVMLEDAPANFITRLMPHHAELCERNRQLRAQLPSYLEQQRASVMAHCPLPLVLQSVVAEYAATTPEDMWTDGLRMQAP